MDERDDNEGEEPAGTAEQQRGGSRFEAGNPYRFQPGQSGNPNGRPKGLSRIAREMLEEIPPEDPERRTRIRLLYEAMWSEAMPRTEERVVGVGAEARTVRFRRRGSYQHARELLDRAIGRVPLAIKVDDGDDSESIDALSVRVVTRGEVEEMRALAIKSSNGRANGNGDIPE